MSEFLFEVIDNTELLSILNMIKPEEKQVIHNIITYI